MYFFCQLSMLNTVSIFKYRCVCIYLGFPGSSTSKEYTFNTGDPSSIPRSGRFTGERVRYPPPVILGFPGGSDGKESTCSMGDLGSIPGLERSPGEGNGNRTDSSILAWSIPMDRGAWQSTVHSVAKSQKRLSD